MLNSCHDVFLLFVSCKQNVCVEYKLTNAVKEDNKLTCFVEYCITNSSSRTLWLYDLESGNDFRFSKIAIADNKCIMTNYLVKPEGIDDWLPAMGYNDNYPITAKLQRGGKHHMRQAGDFYLLF